MMDRKQVGQQRLGVPVTATFDALANAVNRKPWPYFLAGPVGYYFSRMIGGWLLQLMDNALSDEQLRAVAPEEVMTITLLLLRDMFRHNSRLLRPHTPDAGWVEPLFFVVAGDLGLPAARLNDDGQPYELNDMDNCAWARTLAAPFEIPAEKLFACHSAVVTGVRDEFGGAS